jgi:SnoaL-like domain
MFTRRQAIRWAELWLSCWNDGDFDTLLAMHRDDFRFGGPEMTRATGVRIDRKEAMKRHWAAVPYGLHSGPVEFDEIAWDPEAREITVVYVADFDHTRMRGCDLVTLDATGRVIAGEPCLGSIVEEPRAGVQSRPREWILSETAGGR